MAGARIDQASRDLDERLDLAWKRIEKKVSAKWDSIERSTQHEYVRYSDDVNARTSVNYEEGYVEVEAIVEEGDSSATKRLRERLERSLAETAAEQDESGVGVLEGQVTRKDARAFASREVSRRKPRTTSYVGKDGRKRRKATIRVPMPEDSMERRAVAYVPIVRKHSREFKIHPALVLAIMHSESTFNPRARSSCAYGLMQLVPRYGAFEATSILPGVGKKKYKPTPEQLYNPDYNIHLGVGYLYITRRDFFGKLNAPEFATKQAYLLIASYNCGGPRCRKFLKAKGGMDYVRRVSNDRFFDDLRAFVPDETRAYLPRVRKRFFKYDKMLRR